MSDFLCIGDFVCLYCEETEGYVYSVQSSSVHNGVYIYQRQERDKADNIPSPQAVTFQLCIQNRYKLNKKYRKSLESSQPDADEDLETKAMLAQAKMAAVAENEDNVSEQKRQQGKRVRYGEIVQLKHMFTQKYIHVSTTQTSKRDKNNMMVFLQEYNAKHAQFRILPRYKVKSEGEVVQNLDQIVFESVKSPGQSFHSSVPFTIDFSTVGSELNLGVEQTGFTVVKSYRSSEENEQFVIGGAAMRLFHKDLEAYLVAEGLFDDQLTEGVHLRIREMDQMIPKTLYPSSSGITYWQIENETSILKGDVVRWEQQVRFRHMCTRLYLMVNTDMRVTLTTDARNPQTVFRLHPVIKEGDEILFESYARIEHVLSGVWLHAIKDMPYVRKGSEGSGDNKNPMRGLKWDGAEHRQIGASNAQMYKDAYTLKRVSATDVTNFNFVTGMAPFLAILIRDVGISDDKVYKDAYTIHSVDQIDLDAFNYVAGSVPFITELIKDRKEGKFLNPKKTLRICQALSELKDFMIVNGFPQKNRQKLMRNLRIIDLLVRLLQCPLRGSPDQPSLTQVFKAAYEVLYTYMIGNSRKNALYFAKYIEFFQTQFSVKGEIGLNVAQMIVELIRDNRKIVDRITHEQIDEFVGLLRQNKNYRYLDLLGVLCVCDGVAIADNQVYITDKWLKKDTDGLFLTELGQNLKKQMNVVFISTDKRRTWKALHEFVNKNSTIYNEEECLFLEHQLDLFRKLCHGRCDYAIRMITRQLRYLSWEEAFLCLRLDLLPEALRAKYCDLIITLFVDIGNNYDVLDHVNTSFIYEEVIDGQDADGGDTPVVVKDLVTVFPVLRDWITEFFDKNKFMVASDVGHNMLIEQVLRLMHYLVKFGYYGNARDIRLLQKPLLNLLDGSHDMPFPQEKEPKKGRGIRRRSTVRRKTIFGSLHSDNEDEEDTSGPKLSKEAQKVVDDYRAKDRYLPSLETTAVVNAKYQAMEVLDLLLRYQFNTRLKSFVSKFKHAELSLGRKKHQSPLVALLYANYDALDSSSEMSRKEHARSMRAQKLHLKVIKEMFENTGYFDDAQITEVLLDLSNYKYDKMVTKSMLLLAKYYSSKADMFKMAVQSQVLITPESCNVHREVHKKLPILRRLARAKLNQEQVRLVGGMLQQLITFCQAPYDENERHAMNQSILINHGVLSVVFDILSQEIDERLMEQYHGIKGIVVKTLRLLRALAVGNDSVQRRIFDRIETLLKVRVVESEMAVTLKEAFVGNQSTCLKIQPKQVMKIVQLIAEHKEKVPEFLDLLCAIVKVEGMDMALKRNQAFVMKFFMQYYNKISNVLDESLANKERILTGMEGYDQVRYMVGLVDLLATCAEGENRFIESLCQTIMSIDEIFWVLNHDLIQNNLKKAYLKYLIWVYMKTSSSMIDSGAGELTHHGNVWNYMRQLALEVNRLGNYINYNKNRVAEIIKKPPHRSAMAGPNEQQQEAQGTLHYLLEGVMPFLQIFIAKFYCIDRDLYPNEPEIVSKLASYLLMFGDTIRPMLYEPGQLKAILSCMTVVLPASTISVTMIEAFIERFGKVNLNSTNEGESGDGGNAVMKHEAYYAEEYELNAKFRTMAVNCSLLYGGHNTVAAQLKLNSKHALHTPYTEIGGDEALPLGEEFQDYARCFVRTGEKKVAAKYALASKLIEQLGISSGRSKMSDHDRMEQDDLDIKCCQVLRAMVHNEVVRLPEDWDETPAKYKKELTTISELQNVLVKQGALDNGMLLLVRLNDENVREGLAFLCCILFNANDTVQNELDEYFRNTREEVFFMAIRARMNLSVVALKERRALEAQQQSRVKEMMKQAKNMQVTMTTAKKALQEIQAYENIVKRNKAQRGRRVSLSALQSKASKVSAKNREEQEDGERKVKKGSKRDKKDLVLANNGLVDGYMDDDTYVRTKDIYDMEMVKKENQDNQDALEIKVEDDDANSVVLDDEEEMEEIEYKDEGYLSLVLKLMAGMCDGQFVGLQDYLRDQPDNIKAFNLVAEVAQFLNLLYSNINTKTVGLLVELFSTLNEFISGNQDNRSVLVNNKIVDYVNFILRSGDFKDCTIDQILELRQIIANILLSLIEENGPAPIVVAKEVKDTLDKEAIYRVMTECYDAAQAEKQKLDNLMPKKEDIKKFRDVISAAKSLAKVGFLKLKQMMRGTKNAMQEIQTECGFCYFFLLQRMYDIDPNMDTKEDLIVTPGQEKAFKYFKKNSMSVEILKDDHLQKINFRVKNKNVLREEVKEMLKWNVDRSSPSSKIRDLMAWAKDILKDIYYQRRILTNPIAAFLTKNWLIWNYAVIGVSIALNVMMLLTWQAPLSLGEVSGGLQATALPDQMFNAVPVIINMPPELYYLLLTVLGGVHNVFSSLVLISYFLSNNPKLPSIKNMLQTASILVPGPVKRLMFGKKTDDDEEEVEKVKHESLLEVQFLSFTTFYFMAFLGLSIAGTAFHGYCFAFHLLNIVNNNQLLSGVIQSVTKNGKSLLWVAVLGMVVFYLFAIISFALFRSSFDPGNEMYCSTLFECTITIIRYGLIGDYDEKIGSHPLQKRFLSFTYISIFQISFFILITTIGLNIIFGIIVDTFSELRDLKWTAERDMREVCFICSRNSYDFEHHGMGFQHHVQHEHNKWSYIFYFIHLDDTKQNDLTALDLFVHNLLSQEKNEFFPMNRALSLSNADEDTTQSKIDELLDHVLNIVQKQREEESEKKRHEERLKQQKWQEEHRNAIRQAKDSEESTAGDNDPDIALSRLSALRASIRRGREDISPDISPRNADPEEFTEEETRITRL